MVAEMTNDQKTIIAGAEERPSSIRSLDRTPKRLLTSLGIVAAIAISIIVLVRSLGNPTAQHFDSVEELRDEMVSAGYFCPEWHRTEVDGANGVQHAACSGRDSVGVYPSDEEAQVSVYQGLFLSLDSDDEATDVRLVGANWVINPSSEEALQTLHRHLGGTIIRPADLTEEQRYIGCTYWRDFFRSLDTNIKELYC